MKIILSFLNRLLRRKETTPPGEDNATQIQMPVYLSRKNGGYHTQVRYALEVESVDYIKGAGNTVTVVTFKDPRFASRSFQRYISVTSQSNYLVFHEKGDCTLVSKKLFEANYAPPEKLGFSTKPAPMDCSVVEVPMTRGYDRAFYEDGQWWWYNSELEASGDGFGSYAAGNYPSFWRVPKEAKEKTA